MNWDKIRRSHFVCMPNGQSICNCCNYQTKNSRILWEKNIKKMKILFQSIIFQCHAFERFLFVVISLKLKNWIIISMTNETEKINHSLTQILTINDESSECDLCLIYFCVSSIFLKWSWLIGEIISVNEFFYCILLNRHQKSIEPNKFRWLGWLKRKKKTIGTIKFTPKHRNNSNASYEMHSKCSSLSDQVEASR